MKRIYFLLKIALCVSFFHIQLNGQQSNEFSSEALQEDFQILKQSITSLHSGLYRYVDSLTIEKQFDLLQNKFENNLDLKQAYLAISKFLATIQCGHTYANYYNQKKNLQDLFFTNNNKLPFTFQIIDGELILTKNLSIHEDLNNPVKIVSINDISTKDIIRELVSYMHTDGSNYAQKLNQLNVSGQGEFEAFDIYFPMLYGNSKNEYKLDVQYLSKDIKKSFVVTGISREERKDLIEEKYQELEINYDDLWNFEIINPDLAVLQMGTFVTYKMNLNWKKFITHAFSIIKKKNIPNLIIDIRGNAGGMDNVSKYLMKYLLKNEYTLPSFYQYIRTPKVPDFLRPYLSTWSESFYDMTTKVSPAQNGMYEMNKKSKKQIIQPTQKKYNGKVFLFTDASNSSATFHLAKVIKESNSATLIGQTTGGNMKGTTAGAILFLTLPNTNIEIDIPLIATEYGGPDKGLEPNILISPKAEEIASGIDIALEAVLKIIGN